MIYYNNIKSKCETADEIIIATDNDPSGEGTLLACEILLTFYSKIANKKITRMFFEDESEKEIQKAFESRVLIPNLREDLDFLKADYRSKWDYLSIQFSRMATCLGDGYSVLRNGRLKSFMIKSVGDGLEELKNYKKVIKYKKGFLSDTGVWFLNKNDTLYDIKEDVDLSNLKESKVIIDKVEEKETIPPKLLDLAKLSAILESKGFNSKEVLYTYQNMYENHIVSYPRTEDDKITLEQFNELLPYINQLASLVGVDSNKLVVRTPRKTHIATGISHGANRPATNIPNNLDDLSKYGKSAIEIYKLLTFSYLRMFADNYKYEKITAHVDNYEEYIGSINKAKSMGWKSILNDSDEEIDSKNIGEVAIPKIYEEINKKPPIPTMKWLMKKLEKYNVGTGATRTSTYADLVNANIKCPQMEANKGKLTLTDYGMMNYILLKDTYIGSSDLTEQLQKEMKEIGEGKAVNINMLLNKMEEYVMHDLKIMQNNSFNIPENIKHSKDFVKFSPKEKYSGLWKKNNQLISFNREWGGHYFTDEECERLLNCEILEVKLNGNFGEYTKSGKLEKTTYKGNTFIGFKLIE